MNDAVDENVPELLSLEDTEPVELEEVAMPDGYLKAAKKHIGAKFTRLKPNPELGKGAQ